MRHWLRRPNLHWYRLEGALVSIVLIRAEGFSITSKYYWDFDEPPLFKQAIRIVLDEVPINSWRPVKQWCQAMTRVRMGDVCKLQSSRIL